MHRFLDYRYSPLQISPIHVFLRSFQIPRSDLTYDIPRSDLTFEIPWSNLTFEYSQ